jgi:hypothetical protein
MARPRLTTWKTKSVAPSRSAAVEGEFSGLFANTWVPKQVSGLPTDQSYLQKSLSAFEALAPEFPVKGDSLG